jgi:transposase InsO family protein
MRAAGLVGARRGRKVRTTVADPGHERATDKANRNFTAERPNRTWVADFTYVSAWVRDRLRRVRGRRVLPRHSRLVGCGQQAHRSSPERAGDGPVAARPRWPHCR